MTAAQLERLQSHPQRLRLFKSGERLEALLQDATAKELSYADFLDGVLTEEVASKTGKHITMRTNLARCFFVKSLDAFDFSYQPSLDKKQVQTLASCHYVEHGENLLILGPASAKRPWRSGSASKPSSTRACVSARVGAPLAPLLRGAGRASAPSHPDARSRHRGTVWSL